MNFQIISSNHFEVVVRMNNQIYEQFLQFLNQKPQNSEGNVNQDQGFLRRVIPFFMNQFYQWSREEELTSVIELLNTIKRHKTSRQKKFELGDLQMIFKNRKVYNLPTIEVRQQWQCFLENEAFRRVKINRKISPTQIEHYLQSINLLLREINRNSPYFRFLRSNRSNEVLNDARFAEQNSDSNQNGYELLQEFDSYPNPLSQGTETMEYL